MKTDAAFKVKEMISDSDQIYIVRKITDGVMHYTPRVAQDERALVESSIPMANATRASIRRLLTKEEIKAFYKFFKGLDISETVLDYKSLKDTVSLNDPLKTAPILKMLMSNKKNNPNFTRTDDDTLSKILAHLIDEISLVTGDTPKKITTYLYSFIPAAKFEAKVKSS